ncbi:LOW QUALITY PROTEIN: hypothetical protein CFC21_027808 [Triticum aestivum]|uniref:Uncharacterized protein n=2 Tax=Triticum aestivum TaxID=4565 RepID=A0A9R1ENM6_WHEAT|nr:LOW QUALITY PROTEIN: hypothetical protein CFC21_027808 [Triticum aestivum]
MREEITAIAYIAKRSQTLFEVYMRNEETTSVRADINKVIACGTTEGSDEHFITTQLFINREQTEMFLHMGAGTRKGWLHRKFDIKYGN